MTVVRMPPPGSLERIRDPVLRAAAERYEADTGERLAAMFKLPADEGLLGVYLIVRGYSLDDNSRPPPADTPERD